MHKKDNKSLSNHLFQTHILVIKKQIKINEVEYNFYRQIIRFFMLSIIRRLENELNVDNAV